MSENLISEYIIPIIIGLLTTYLSQLFPQIGKWIISKLVHVSKIFSNLIYKNISSNLKHENDSYIFLGILAVLYTTIYMHNQLVNIEEDLYRIEIKTISNEINTEYQELHWQIIKNDSLLKSEVNKVYQKDKKAFINRQLTRLKKEKQILAKKLSELNKLYSNAFDTKVDWITFFIQYLIIMIILIWTFIINYIIGIQAKFKKSLLIIRPYISEYTYHELNQKWALIQNKDDYNNLNLSIENIINSNIQSENQPYNSLNSCS